MDGMFQHGTSIMKFAINGRYKKLDLSKIILNTSKFTSSG